MRPYPFMVGFSLIELMIVVSIIGILAMMAIPSYQHYTLRARFAEVIAATAPYKIAVSLALQQGTPLTEITSGKNGVPKAPKSTKSLESLSVDSGIITATATDIIQNTTYILAPKGEGNVFVVSGTCVTNGLCNA